MIDWGGGRGALRALGLGAGKMAMPPTTRGLKTTNTGEQESVCCPDLSSPAQALAGHRAQGPSEVLGRMYPYIIATGVKPLL